MLLVLVIINLQRPQQMAAPGLSSLEGKLGQIKLILDYESSRESNCCSLEWKIKSSGSG